MCLLLRFFRYNLFSCLLEPQKKTDEPFSFFLLYDWLFETRVRLVRLSRPALYFYALLVGSGDESVFPIKLLDNKSKATGRAGFGFSPFLHSRTSMTLKVVRRQKITLLIGSLAAGKRKRHRWMWF